MARRKMDPEKRSFIKGLLEHYQPKDAQDVQNMLKDLLGETLQDMLESEMDEHLGYSKYDYRNKETEDSRNGYSAKTVTSSMGPIELDIPRDRNGEFEPQIVKKHQTDISTIEDQVLSMYAKGMTTRDISKHLQDVYGVDASAEMISHMTDRILPSAREWQNRPLERKYAIVYMDAVHFLQAHCLGCQLNLIHLMLLWLAMLIFYRHRKPLTRVFRMLDCVSNVLRRL